MAKGILTTLTLTWTYHWLLASVNMCTLPWNTVNIFSHNHKSILTLWILRDSTCSYSTACCGLWLWSRVSSRAVLRHLAASVLIKNSKPISDWTSRKKQYRSLLKFTSLGYEMPRHGTDGQLRTPTPRLMCTVRPSPSRLDLAPCMFMSFVSPAPSLTCPK